MALKEKLAQKNKPKRKMFKGKTLKLGDAPEKKSGQKAKVVKKVAAKKGKITKQKTAGKLKKKGGARKPTAESLDREMARYWIKQGD